MTVLIKVLSILVGVTIVGISFYIAMCIVDLFKKKKPSSREIMTIHNSKQLTLDIDSLIEKVHQQQEYDRKELGVILDTIASVIYNKKDEFLFQNILLVTLKVADIIDKCNIDNIYVRRIKNDFETAPSVGSVLENFSNLGLDAKIYKNHLIDIEKINKGSL